MLLRRVSNYFGVVPIKFLKKLGLQPEESRITLRLRRAPGEPVHAICSCMASGAQVLANPAGDFDYANLFPVLNAYGHIIAGMLIKCLASSVHRD
ncbi:hypothetical protein BH11PSE11_BH11PSE11_28450 [soil metagenome]